MVNLQDMNSSPIEWASLSVMLVLEMGVREAVDELKRGDLLEITQETVNYFAYQWRIYIGSVTLSFQDGRLVWLAPDCPMPIILPQKYLQHPKWDETTTDAPATGSASAGGGGE